MTGPAVERCTVGGSSINQGRQYMDIVVASSVTAHQGVELEFNERRAFGSARPGSTRRSCASAATALPVPLFTLFLAFRGVSGARERAACAMWRAPGRRGRRAGRRRARSPVRSRVGASAAPGTGWRSGRVGAGCIAKWRARAPIPGRAAAQRETRRDTRSSVSSGPNAAGRRRERASAYRPGCG